MLRRFSSHHPRRCSLSSRSLHATTSIPQCKNDPNSECPPLPTCPHAFVRILSSAAKSSSLSTGTQLHSPIAKLGLTSNVFVGTALLDLYGKCHDIKSAQQLFDEMPHRNVVTWNALIHSHSQSRLPILSVKTFIEMVAGRIPPTPFSISSVIISISRLGELRIGMMLHCITFKLGFCGNVVVGTSLVDMYSKCSGIVGARRVFDEMIERNVITWTSLVTGYALDRRPNDAMTLVRDMRRVGAGMNSVTYNSLISSFSSIEDLAHGKQVHCLVIREGVESDPYVSVTLVTMYSKCGNLEDFVNACLSVSIQDQVSCNSVIAGFSHLGDGRKVLERFVHMRRECIDADFFTFASILRAIGILSALEEGRQIHALILKTGHDSNVGIQNAIVSMYAKCGAIKDSKQAFSSMNEPDLISWNSLLSGCAQHGYGVEAVELFEQMRRIGVRPNHTTFLSVLTACSHIGFVEKGLEYFYMMKQEDPPIAAGHEHCACVVDLLGRAGYLNEAESFINNMPIEPGVSVYRALLSSCQIYGNAEIAKRAAKCLLELDPNDPATHVLLSNVFAADGHWDNAARVRREMRGIGLRKQPAWSLIEGQIAAM